MSGRRNWKSAGGQGRNAKATFVSNSTSNQGNTVVSGVAGQNNSKTVYQGHVDVSDNSLLNVGCIYFSDGTVQCTAGGTGGAGG